MKNGVRVAAALLLCVFFATPSLQAEESRKTETEEERTVLGEITVTGTRHGNPVTPKDTRYGTRYNVVTEEEIREQNSHDFHSTLRNVPGVIFQSKNLVGSQTSHSLYIRGRGMSHPSADFTILFDGAPRYGGLFGQVLGDGIPVSAIGGIEVYKSPQPSQFGSGYGSINVLPKHLTIEGWEGALTASGGSYGTFDEDFSVGVSKEPFDVYMSQSRVRTDGHREHSGADQESYYLYGGYQINHGWNIRFLLNYVDGSTDAPPPNVTPTATNGVTNRAAERYQTETLFTTITLNHKYDRFSGYLKAYHNETDFDLLQELLNGERYGGNTGGLKSRQEIRLYGMRGKETLHFWPGGEIVLGADLDMTDLKNTQRTYSGLATAGINGGLARRVWDFPGTQIVSPYGAVSQEIGHREGLHFVPSIGVRYYTHDEFKDKAAAQGGLVFGYKNTGLTMNYSRGVIYPTPVALMNFVLESAPVANARQYWRNLKPEVVDHYEAGIVHTWPNKGSLGATIFRDQGKDRFQAYMFGPIPLQFNDPVGHYKIRGLELTGTALPTKNLELFCGATWLQSQASGQNRVDVDRLPYTPSFQFQAGLRWTYLEKFRLSADMQHLKGLYQGTLSRAGTFNISDPGHINKLDDITLMNARLSYRFDYAPLRLKASEGFVAVDNIFSHDYEYAKGYPMAGTTIFAGVSLRFQ